MSEAMTVEIDATDRAILAVLREGRATQGMLIDKTPHSRGQIQRELGILRAGGYIEKIHDRTALYGIADKGKRELGETNG
jgi:uncharacterized membrane protein